jgi:hypothetical protein
MKRIILFSIMVITSLSTFAQNASKDSSGKRSDKEIRTLMGNDHQSNGGYGSFGFGYTRIMDQDAVVFSASGAWIVGQYLAFGFAGKGFVNSSSPGLLPERVFNLTGGYGGLLLEPIIFPRYPVHLSFPTIAGVGGIAYTTSYQPDNSWEYYDTRVEDVQSYLIVEPGVELELNIVRFFRLALGVSYRFTTDVDWIYTNQNVLDGWNAEITFKFGKF